MNKIKFYSTLGLLTLSASLLVGCGSSQNESTVESATKTSQTTSSQEKTKASSSKSKEKTTVPPKTTAQSTKEDNVEVSTETENNQVAAEQSTIAPTGEVVASPAQEVTETPTTPVQETTLTDAAAPAIDYSSLAGKWRNAAGSEIIYNDKGEVVSVDGVVQAGWTPSQNQTVYGDYHSSLFMVNYDGGYAAILPAGVEYNDGYGYVSNSATGVDRLLVGNAAIDFDREDVYYRVN